MVNLRDIARQIFDESLADCSVEESVRRHVFVREETLNLGEETIDLANIRRVRIVAVGKAARTMLVALLPQLKLPRPCDLAGILIAPEESTGRNTALPPNFQYFAGGHPSPNSSSFAGARAALAMLQDLPQDSAENSLCLFLVSGGASAMMELPLDPSISLSETADFHRVLVGSGASISEINCVRKHFSAVKGGRLAQAAGNAICRSLLISDVPVGCEDALGSGPTVPDVSTIEECRDILERYDLLARFPNSVQRFFQSDALVETPKPSELRAHASVLLSAQTLAAGAAKSANALGFFAVIDNSCDEWEYKAAARHLLEGLRALRRNHTRLCMISTGEVGVTLPSIIHAESTVGIGGRNQQFALYAATLLQPEDDPMAILSAGSDGIDGNSPAAGAVVDRETVCGDARLEATEALEAFDAFPYLSNRGAAITTGPSGNNLRDLRIFLCQPPQMLAAS